MFGRNFHRFFEEDGAVHVFVCVVRWREVLADIAFADSAEDRIGDCMEADICVGMAFELVCVRNIYTAEANRAFAIMVKGMNVIT